jgi:hypothetical protein
MTATATLACSHGDSIGSQPSAQLGLSRHSCSTPSRIACGLENAGSREKSRERKVGLFVGWDYDHYSSKRPRIGQSKSLPTK